MRENDMLNTFISQFITNTKVKDKDFFLRKLKGDASTREYHRVHLKNDCKESFILCLEKKGISKDDDYYQVYKFLKERNIRIPDLLEIDWHNGFLLLEDLGDLTLLDCLSQIRSIEEEQKIYKKCIDMLINLQQLNVSNVCNMSFLNRFFDMEKYIYEINFTNENFIRGLLKTPFTEKLEAIIIDFFKKNLLKVISEPFCFVHRDFHSKNIMLKNEELVLIDFQDARLGPIYYDLMSLLEDCYYSVDISNKEKLLNYYFEKLGRYSCANYEYFLELCDIMAIQRIYKAIGTFSYMYIAKNNVSYLKYIGYAMENLKRILLNHSRMDLFRNNLFEVYYGNR